MLKTLYNGINAQNLKNVALQHYKSSCRQNVRNPIFATPLLTPGLESVGPCGPLGHLSGNLSSQVRGEGHLDTGAGINVPLPVLPKKQKETSQEDAPSSSRLFASIIQPPHATQFCKRSSWSPIMGGCWREVLLEGSRQGATCPNIQSKTPASLRFPENCTVFLKQKFPDLS